MNKKGFTFVELLGTIIILSIVLLIAVPAINGVNNSIKQSHRKSVIKRIEIAASKYAFDTEKTEVYVKDLINEGYMDGDNKSGEILDPVDNTVMNCYKITMEKQSDYYSATFIDKNEMVNGTCN